MESLDVDDVLRRIVEAAVGLVRARSGAIAAFDAHGAVERIVHARDPEQGASDTPNPLGDALNAGGAVRVQRIEHDPRQIGLAVEDGQGTTFLAVPIRTRSDAYGALYLSGRDDGPFTRDDEELMTALAAIAGIALENARL
ncbi:GAF domain-containing protein, partial [Microbacterium sp.]|uniref:GAF domain-containing protein n=1 Tax=Microbacterium sp. TaxID=51671 RepID=UPI002811C759